MIPSEKTNKILMTDLKKMEIYKFSDQNYRIIFLNQFSKPEDHTIKQNQKIYEKMRSLRKQQKSKIKNKNINSRV